MKFFNRNNNEIYWIQRKKSIKTRQLILFAIFLMLNVIFSMILYFVATSSVKKSIFDKMNAQANFYLETLDTQFYGTQNMMYNLFSDRKLVFLVYPTNLLNDYELRDAYLSEQERIMLLKNSNSLISTGVIYLPNVGVRISDSGITKMAEVDYETVRQRYLLVNNPINNDGDALFMASAGTPSNNYGETPEALFVVEFSEVKLRDTLRKFNTIENSGSFLYHEEQKIFIESSVNYDDIGGEILDKIRLTMEKSAFYSDIVRLNGQNYQVSVAKSGYFGYFVQYIPEKVILKNIKGYKWIMLIYIIVVSLVAVVFSKSIQNIIHKPLNKLMKAFSRVEKDGLGSGVTEYTGENEFSYLFEGFNKMQNRTKELVEEVLLQKSLAQQAELKQLQAQINPHFLYNSFMSLRNKIKREDLDMAEQLASHLSSYFRFLTRNDESNVSLKNEVEHARSYTNIQNMRFYDRIKVSFDDLPVEYERIQVPRLILQPIIENALQYGLEEKVTGGILNVTFLKDDDILEVHVEDNGDQFTDIKITELKERLNKTDEITGIINIHNRLKLFFGKRSGIDIKRSHLGGAEIIIKIVIPGSD